MDIETRRKKQQALMVKMVERKVRSRAQQLYEKRGQSEGQDLQDWLQAESEVVESTVLARLYRRLGEGPKSDEKQSATPVEETACEGRA